MNIQFLDAIFNTPDYRSQTVLLGNNLLFIRELDLNYLCRIYKAYLDSIEIERQPKMIRELILKNTQNTCYYLIENDHIQLGRVMAIPKNYTGIPGNIIRGGGELFSCSDRIFPNDPLIQKNREILLVLDDPLIARFDKNGKVFNLHIHAFYRFLKRGKPLERIAEISGITGQNAYLLNLFEIFKSSIKVKRKNSVNQIIKYNELADYYFNNNWFFVVINGNFIKTCYLKQGSLKKLGYIPVG